MEPKFVCNISSCGATVNYYSEIDLYAIFNNQTYSRDYPEIKLSKEKPIGNINLYYENSDDVFLEIEPTSIIARYPWEDMRRGEALLYLSYPLIERQHQHAAGATVHAACVSVNGEGILLLGGQGAGKTSIVLELCRHNEGIMIANDLSVIKRKENHIYCEGGTKYIFMRYESIKRTHHDLLCHFPNCTGDTWAIKIPIEAAEVGVPTSTEPVEIKHIYRLHIDNSQNKLYSHKTTDLGTKLTLNEELSRYIRNTTTALVTGSDFRLSGYVPSLDTPDYFWKRAETIRVMTEEIGIQYISGPLDQAAEFIISRLT